jgi:hypothetical protein
MWRQGVRSHYRRHYWRFLWLILWNWTRQPVKLWLGFMTLLSAHHFLNYAHQVADELEQECRASRELRLTLAQPHGSFVRMQDPASESLSQE